MMFKVDVWGTLKQKGGKSRFSQEPASGQPELQKNRHKIKLKWETLQIDQTQRFWKDHDVSFPPLSSFFFKISKRPKSRGKRKINFHFTTSGL